MAYKHGINTYKDRSDTVSVQTAAVGIPFFIGAWPCHMGGGYVGKPQLAESFDDAESLGGYSDEWRDGGGAPKWSLCQAAYGYHKLGGMAPAIYYNVYNPAVHYTASPAADYAVTDHVAVLSGDAIVDSALIVKAGDEVLESGVDYDTYYSGGALCVELTESSGYYTAAALNISYNAANPAAITAEDIEEAVEAVEMCRGVVGIVPDLLCAPGWSVNPEVAAVMGAKAPYINGLYRAKAVVDLDTTIADDYTKVLAQKSASVAAGVDTVEVYTSEDMVVCWPMVKRGDYVFDLSVIVCATIAKVDSGNDDCPYESPSNKDVPITGAVLADGTEVNLSLPQADIISVTDGVVTVINYNGWVLWGNYMGCYPQITDAGTAFVCTNRVMDWICNTFVNTFWPYIDRPMTPALRDAITNTFNAWLNGLVAENKLYGGEIKYESALNPVTNLLDGMFRLDCVVASPVPAQRIDMHASYSVEMLESALS